MQQYQDWKACADRLIDTQMRVEELAKRCAALENGPQGEHDDEGAQRQHERESVVALLTAAREDRHHDLMLIDELRLKAIEACALDFASFEAQALAWGGFADARAAILLGGDPEWRNAELARQNAVELGASYEAMLADLRGDVPDAGESHDFGTVRVTYPKVAMLVKASADDVRRLIAEQPDVATTYHLREEKGSEPKPKITIRRAVSPNVARAAIKADVESAIPKPATTTPRMADREEIPF